MEWTEPDGRKVSKLVFLLYAPDENNDNAEKFVIACNKDLLKTKVSEVNLDVQINSWDDLDEQKLIGKFNK